MAFMLPSVSRNLLSKMTSWAGFRKYKMFLGAANGATVRKTMEMLKAGAFKVNSPHPRDIKQSQTAFLFWAYSAHGRGFKLRVQDFPVGWGVGWQSSLNRRWRGWAKRLGDKEGIVQRIRPREALISAWNLATSRCAWRSC